MQLIGRQGKPVPFTNIVQRPRGLKSSQAVTFREGRPGAAPEIASWFPMGAGEGHQFVY